MERRMWRRGEDEGSAVEVGCVGVVEGECTGG